MRNQKNEIMGNAMKVAKRIAITILCCLPVLLIFSYFTEGFITSRVARVICFMLIMGVAVLIEELIARKREKEKVEKEIIETKKDVFR